MDNDINLECERLNNYKIISKDGSQYSRIYHSHIRKCAGTAFNHKFIGNSCNQEIKIIKKIYGDAAKNGGSSFHNGKAFVGWNKKLIESGNYFYAWSHIPMHNLKLPKNTFILTTFRDPVERVISHYKMIYEYYISNIDHPCMKTEGKWLGQDKTIIEFAKNMPKEHLFAQLFHYSSSYSVDEAIERIKTINFVANVENLNSVGYQTLMSILPSINLPSGKIREGSRKIYVKSIERDSLRELLIGEYSFLELLNKEITVI